jgi:hypothetical protein
VLTRRFAVCGLFVLVSVASTGCCGRLRNCVYRFRHCHGCCTPSFDAPVYDVPVAAGPAPGCATCFAPPAAAHAIPVSATTPVFSAPLPTQLGPPTVTQTTEPPMAKPGAGK